MANKGSSPQYKGEGGVQRLAKDLQVKFKLGWAAAVVEARKALGLAP